MKLIIGFLCFVMLIGCAGIRTWTLEMSQEDLANAVVSRQIADNLLSTWSLNSGVMQCGAEDVMPPVMLRKIVAIDASVKAMGKWSQPDYDKGCFLGRRANLTYEQLKSLFDLVVPIVLKMVGK